MKFAKDGGSEGDGIGHRESNRDEHEGSHTLLYHDMHHVTPAPEHCRYFHLLSVHDLNLIMPASKSGKEMTDEGGGSRWRGWDTEAHVDSIVKLDQVAISTGEEDEYPILDLSSFLNLNFHTFTIF